MTQAARLALVSIVLTMMACRPGPDGESSRGVAPISVVDLSQTANATTPFRFVASGSHIVVATTKVTSGAWLIRYDASGQKQLEFNLPGIADSAAILDMAAGDAGQFALLANTEHGQVVQLRSESGHLVHEYLLKQDVTQIAFTLRQIFALTAGQIIRVDDNTLVSELPDKHTAYYLTAKDAKLMAVAKSLPLMFTFDLATNRGSVSSIESPELSVALEQSIKSNPRIPAIVGAAVDADGTTYIAVSPANSQLTILKVNESGERSGKFHLQLTTAMDAQGGIAYLEDHLLVLSPRSKRLATYEIPRQIFVP